jgi:hypothetical protein
MTQKKLTEPQRRMKERFNKGDRIKTVNSHYASGGHYAWDSSGALCNYKVFWGMIRSIYGFPNPIPDNDRLKYFVK